MVYACDDTLKYFAYVADLRFCMDIRFQSLKNVIRGEAFLSFLSQAQRENEEAERETERKLKDGWQVQDRKQRQLKQTLVLYSCIIVIILLQHTLAS